MNFKVKNLLITIIVALSLISCQEEKSKQQNITNKGMIEKRKESVLKYFEKIDKGIFDDSYFNLFTEDVELYFPKYGFSSGKDGIKDFGKTLGNNLKRIYHKIDEFNIIASDKYVIVEGQEGGETKDGIKWPDNKISYGKFCNVFEFEGNLIKRVHIYVDPDFTSEDIKRIEILTSKK